MTVARCPRLAQTYARLPANKHAALWKNPRVLLLGHLGEMKKRGLGLHMNFSPRNDGHELQTPLASS